MKEFDVYKRLVNKAPKYPNIVLNEFRDILRELPDGYLEPDEIRAVEDAIDRGEIKDITPRWIAMLTELKEAGVNTDALFKYIEPNDYDEKFTEVVAAYIKHVLVPKLGKHAMAETKLEERNRDGTGPKGKGPRTGRGKGICKPKKPKEEVKERDMDVELAKKVLKYSEKGSAILGGEELQNTIIQKKKARDALKKAGLTDDKISSEEIEEGYSAVKKQFKDKVPQEVWPRLEAADPTEKKKNMEWIVRQYVKDPGRLGHLIDVMRLFNRQVMSNQRQGRDTDLYQFKTLQDLDTSVEGLLNQEGEFQKEKETKAETRDLKSLLYQGNEGLAKAQEMILKNPKSANVVFENDNVKMVEILDHDAAMAFRNLQDEDDSKSWCTTRKHDYHWNNYDGQGKKFYHVIIKKKDPVHPKFAVEVWGAEYNPHRTVYDHNDQTISYDKFAEMMNRLMGEDR